MNYCVVHSPLGPLYMGEEEGALVYLTAREPAEGTEGTTLSCGRLRSSCGNILKAVGQSSAFPLAPHGTPFQKAVWAALCKVPYGQTVSYGQLAAMAGRPKAARAVGSAMAQNPIAIIQPCHRILPAGGDLGHYSMGGPANKEWLLQLERQNLPL